uniref:Prephenate/arogenate dehydrogenase domain-containing protein n=1 Tax=Musa acuminata subsp. malaccensis TaxID=214687 RepID=A0A804JPM7_MUSAM
MLLSRVLPSNTTLLPASSHARAAPLRYRHVPAGGGAITVPVRRSFAMTIRARDSAPVLDVEPQPLKLLDRRTKLKIAVIGFGNFGQFLARTFAAQGHEILAYSRTDYSDTARSLGVAFFDDQNDLCEQQPDVVLLSTSILSAEAVLRSLPIQRLRRSTLFVDVLSVKEFPKNLFLQLLPPDFDILCTHPMFGPDSGKHGWAGLPFAYDKVRIGDSDDRVERCRAFLEIFDREGCRMVEMSCAEHDETAAEIQFLTHTIGRVLAKLDLKSTPINTKGYETLLNLVQNTCSDSYELYNGLFIYNKNSTELIEKLNGALDTTKKELFERLHGIFRKQLFEGSARKFAGGVRYRHVSAGGAITIPVLRRSAMTIQAREAAPVLDIEPQPLKLLDRRTKLKIAVIGFGNFGQFLARTFAAQGHEILAYSRTDYSDTARSLGAAFFDNQHDLCEQHPDVVLLSTSILSAEAVLRSLPIQRLRRSTLFVDVLSVKEFPRNLFLQLLPPDFDILCTHPMFGPESGKHGWAGLPFVYDKVRIGDSDDRIERCRAVLEIFEREGCRMVEMSCAEHDETAAEIQFLTHTIGRVLAKLDLKSTPINTKGYETLLNLVQNTCSDSYELYNGLFIYNKNSTELIEKLDDALDTMKKELFQRLHGIFRKQLFESSGRRSIDAGK